MSARQRAVVMGLGRFGGGLGASQFLLSQGWDVLVTDMASEESLAGSIASVREAAAPGRLRLRLGGHDTADFQAADLVVANAAVPKPWDHPMLIAARHAGVPVVSEINLLVSRLPSRNVVGVTGSAGKSTTSAMLHLMLESGGIPARLGGNIGGSLLGESIGVDEWVVLELSSAMLWWLGEGARTMGGAGAGVLPWSPRVAVLTNITPNHNDWHGGFEDYVRSKGAIRSEQVEGDRFLTRFEEELPDEAARAAASAEAWWRPCAPARDGCPATPALAIPGEHMRRNAGLAMEAAWAVAAVAGRAIEAAGALGAISRFRGLAHRLQLAGEVNGIRCFNDSKATTPEATLRAVASFEDPGRVHLIAGGYDKGIDLSSIRDLAGRLAGLYAIGATEPSLAPAPPARRCGTLAHAVEQALDSAEPGDILLLSPGCASWDQFDNFERRGEAFLQLLATRGAR